MLGWMNHKLESRLSGQISTTSEMQVIPQYSQKAKKSKILLIKVKEESEKTCLKTQHSKTKIMASGFITSGLPS